MVRILLVDDSQDFLESASKFLSANSDLQVVGHALSGESALEEALQLHPDLVLMDLSMPGIDGIEATRRLKEQDRLTRVIILTLYDEAEYRSAADAVSADGFVTKSEFGIQLVPLIETLFAEDGAAGIEQPAG